MQVPVWSLFFKIMNKRSCGVLFTFKITGVLYGNSCHGKSCMESCFLKLWSPTWSPVWSPVFFKIMESCSWSPVWSLVWSQTVF